MKVIQETRSAH